MTENKLKTNKTMTNESSRDITYISMLKIIACFLVIVNHTNSVIFLTTTSNKLWTTSMISFYICKMAVPIFILISGALILSKEYDYKKTIRKFIKFFLILIFISLIYYIYSCSKENVSFSIKEFIINLYNNNNSYHLWYIYLYLSIIIMIPFLQKLIKGMSQKDFIIFFIISILINSSLIIIPHYYPQFELSNFYLYIFHPYVGLLLTGYYIENILTIKNKKMAIAICLIIILLFPLLSTYLTYIEKINNPESYLFFDNIELINITIPSIATFILIKLLIKNKEKPASKIINCIANNTMIIYLIHMLIIENTVSIYDLLQKYLPIQISMYIWEFAIFLIALIIALIIKQLLKILRKWSYKIKENIHKNFSITN